MELRTVLTETLRRDADSHAAKQIDIQSIYFQQGRDIAKAYIEVIKSYARLDAKSGKYEQDGDYAVVSGFCRLEEHHFGDALLKRTQKQNFWTAKWHETVALRVKQRDLFDAFCTSFAEFCKSENIRTGDLCALVRTKDGKLEQRPFPVETVLPEYTEAVGFPYQVRF